jgi:hypothetical protein
MLTCHAAHSRSKFPCTEICYQRLNSSQQPFCLLFIVQQWLSLALGNLGRFISDHGCCTCCRAAHKLAVYGRRARESDFVQVNAGDYRGDMGSYGDLYRGCR